MTNIIDESVKQRILDQIGAIVELRAKQLCPVDLGELRASIKRRVEGNKVIIYTDLTYARDMEFGTLPNVMMSAQEEKDIEEWAARHGLPGGPVARKIKKMGIKAGTPEAPLKTPSGYRPYLRPALLQSLPDIKKIIKRELS